MARKVISNIFKLVVGFVFFIPITWMLVSSLKTNNEIILDPIGLPEKLNFSNYISAWVTANFGSYFLNSVIIVIGAMILLVFVCTLAAYAFARFKVPLKNVILYIVLFGLIIPNMMLIFPIYRFFDRVGLMNNLFGLILLYVAFGIPFSVFILRSYFLSFPTELEDAALIDGCNRFSTFFRIVLPASKGAISTVLIFQFIGFWNEFVFAYLLLNSDKLRPVSAGLGNFSSMFKTDYAGLFAASAIATLPVLIIFLIFQRYFIEALAGSLKG